MLLRRAVMQALDILHRAHPAAVKIALHVAACQRAAVAHVILRHDHVAVLCEEGREMIVAQDMLGDAVHDLHDRLRRALRRPPAAMDASAFGLQIVFFHFEPS